jgi:hypothetical protein
MQDWLLVPIEAVAGLIAGGVTDRTIPLRHKAAPCRAEANVVRAGFGPQRRVSSLRPLDQADFAAERAGIL